MRRSLFLTLFLAPLYAIKRTQVANKQIRRPTKGEYVLTTLGWAELRVNLKLLPGSPHPFLIALTSTREHRQIFDSVTDIMLDFLPVAESDRVYRNGLLQAPNVDYVLVGSRVKFLNGLVMDPQDIVQVIYRS